MKPSSNSLREAPHEWVPDTVMTRTVIIYPPNPKSPKSSRNFKDLVVTIFTIISILNTILEIIETIIPWVIN